MLEKRLEYINEVSEELLEIVKPYFDNFPKDLENSEFPKTSKLIFYLIVRIKEISEGILDTTYNFNNYSSNILLRTLFEHYLTFTYVSERLSEDKNDSVGEEYYEHRMIKEEKDYNSSLIKQLKILKQDDRLIEETDIINKNKPNLKKYTKSELDRINSQFKIGSIIKYLIREVDLEKMDKDDEIPPELHPLIYFTHYSYLSSYIHGGPFAERMLIKYQDIKKRDERLQNMAENAFTLCHGAFSIGLLIFANITGNDLYNKLSAKIINIQLNEDRLN